MTPKDLAEIFQLSLDQVAHLPIPRVLALGLARYRREDVAAFIERSVVSYDHPLERDLGLTVPIDEVDVR